MIVVSVFGLVAAIATTVINAAPIVSGDATARKTHMRSIFKNSMPSAKSVASWSQGDSQSSPIVMIEVSASVPSVNLENVPGLISIDCSVPNTATAMFESVDRVAKWTVQPTLLLIAGRHHCAVGGTAKFAMLLAKSWTIGSDGKTVTLQTADPEASGVTGSFELIAVPAVAKPTGRNTNQIHKRDFDMDSFDDDYIYYDSIEEEPTPKTILDRTIPFSINKEFSDAVSFKVPKTATSINAMCNNCFVRSESAIKMLSKGSLFPFSFDFSVEWSGSLNAGVNLGFDSQSSLGSIANTSATPIFDFELIPIFVPGVFEATSVFRMYSVATFNVDKPITVSVQLGATMSGFNASLSTREGIQVKGFTPVFSSDTKSTLPTTSLFSVAIIPELSIHATMFETPVQIAKTRIVISQETHIEQLKPDHLCSNTFITTVLEVSIAKYKRVYELFKPFVIYDKCVDF